MKFILIRQAPAGLFLRQIIIINGADFLTQQEQGNQVGDNHKTVEHIRQAPNQIDFTQRTQDNGKQNQRTVNTQMPAAEQKADIGLTEIIPTDDGGKVNDCVSYRK